MSTMSLPRRAAAPLAALVAVGSVLAVTPSASAAPGDNGDVKIHVWGKPEAEPDNNPHVCRFYLDAFNFDPGETVNWKIETQPPSTGGTPRTGSEVMDALGNGHTDEIKGLPDGHYRLTWLSTNGHGAGKHKVFWIDCGPGGPGGGNGGGNGGPNGGPPAGGGGLAKEEAFSPVAGAAAVGLAAVAGTVWFRLRRRSHGAA